MPLYPLTFQPIFKERVWGGRELERLYGKSLPASVPIGESWEISDRPGDTSVITNGPLAGKDLHWVVEHHAEELLGQAPAQNGRFPLLIKLLDAREKLSVQVHPPAAAARESVEAKTEMWYIAHAANGAELFIGLKKGVTREQFEQKIRDGTVAECLHRVPVRTGDAMFLPSGRIHAIGGGVVLFEIQQNSDTTYRVFDWNRPGLDGKPRQLHVEESLGSIDFSDFEPALTQSYFASAGRFKVRALARDPLFKVDLFRALSREAIVFRPSRFRIVAVLEKSVSVADGANVLELRPGQFCLIPAGSPVVEIRNEIGSSFLLIEPGR